jgi:hypothetical protein
MPSHPHRSSRRYVVAALMALAIAAAASAAGAQTPAPAPAPQATPASAEKPLPPEQRDRYLGTYEVPGPDGTMSIRIYVEGNKLMGAPGDDEPSALIYQGGDTFRPQMAMDATIVFTVVDGRATKFTYNPPDGSGGIEATRKQ